MRAVVCTGYGPSDVLELQQVEKPVPKDHEVLIKVHATTVHRGGLTADAARELCAPGLRAALERAGLPPVIPVGACVDNTRTMFLWLRLAEAAGTSLAALPLFYVGAEPGNEKAEGYIYSDSCRNPVILVDQSAEPGNAEHLTGGAGQGWLGFRGLKRQPPMRSLPVVVADVLPEDSQEMSLAADEDVVRTLAPCGSHESFGDGVCRGRAYRRADDPHSFRAKHLIEGSRVLGVAVPDQELGASQVIFHHQVAGLLCNPGGIGMGSDASQVDPACGEFDEEKNIERLQPDSLHTEEVAGHDAGSLLSQELLPRRTISPWGRRESMAA